MSESDAGARRAPKRGSRAGAGSPAASERGGGQPTQHSGQTHRNSRGRRRGSRSLGQAPRRRTPKPFTPQQIEARRASVPTITYPPQLPVSARREDIAHAILNNQVVIVAGETGSGKTTQLPKICLELGRGITGMIGHTQPRRIAARSVADRISEELGQKLGETIGYQVRFTEEVSEKTLVKLMTDGILLAEIQSDPQLRRYDTIIIDEAHERSLNIDFLLGYLARLLPQRPDLKVIITSATIDSERFAAHFGEHAAGGRPGDTAPIIEVSGRTFPVEIRYRPLTGVADDAAGSELREYSTGPDGRSEVDEPRRDAPERLSRAQSKDMTDGIVEAARELMAEGTGDILVFLSGEGEIHETEKAFRDEFGQRYLAPGETSTHPGAVEVLPLFARLSNAEQRRVFAPHRHRRIVLATNIAETSLTVPGIHYVIDPGYARISRYSNKTKVQRLPIEEISQASANQRSGRSGRVADGIAIRLYSEENFAARPEFTEPEIQRTALASVILQMASLGLGEVQKFPFIDPPDLRSIRDGVAQLEEIGALEPGLHVPTLTDTGRALARLPIDPRLGRMLLAAVDNGATSEVLVLVAAMSVQDVRERPAEQRAQADQLHARFTEPTSDFLAYLNLWRYLRTQQRELSGSAFRRMCHEEFLHWLRFREWADVVEQLTQLARELHLTVHPIALPSRAQIRAEQDNGDNSHNQDVARAVKTVGRSKDAPAADAIHRSLLTGLLSSIGTYSERHRDYLGARGTHFVIWPGSGLHKRTPDWVMAAELVETSRLFARTVAKIDPEWIERIAGPLVKKQYTEPHWSTRQGAALAHEKVMLYGLTLIADRKVLLSKVGTPTSRELARELFIRHALVDNQWRTHHAFVKYNKEQLAQAREVEERLRQVGVVADETAQFTFFDERIPESIVSARHFDSWWKKERHAHPELLNFTQEFLLGESSASEENFPTEWVQGDITLPIDYTFNPGSHSDGLTIDVPVTLLPQLTDAGFDWLVPGMLDELVTSTIRALPKPVRRQLVPAPDVAKHILDILPDWDAVAHGQPGAPSFRKAFTDAVYQLRRVDVTDADWDAVTLPAHLEVTFRVRSERGAVLDQSTSITHLQKVLAPQTQGAVENVVKSAVAQALEEAKAALLGPEAAGSANAPTITGAEQPLGGWPPVAQGVIPEVIETTGPHGMVVRGYPALVEVPGKAGVITQAGETATSGAQSLAGLDGVTVELRVLAEPAEQVRDHRLGVIRLVASEVALPEGRVTSRWTGDEALAMSATPYPSTSALVADLQLAATRNLAEKWAKETKNKLGRLREREVYEQLREWVRARVEDEIYRIVRICVRVFSAWGDVESAVRVSTSVALLATVSDVKMQVEGLVYNGFISATPDVQLAQYPRYLAAAVHRIEKAAANPAADDALAWQVQTVTDKYERECEEFAREPWNAERAGQLKQAKWMIEELRVSLFAQQLGTQGKVSVQRIEKVLRG
ncbi:ATP-dependent RNA helicase HrpA [Arcanobacterium wilhelmae]